METIPPKTRVPDEWIHPVLKKQLMKRGRVHGSPAKRIQVVEQHLSDIGGVVGCMNQALSNKRLVLEEMDRKRKKKMAEVEMDEEQLQRLQHLHERLTYQLILQKTLEKQESCDMWSMEEEPLSFHCALAIWGADTWGKLAPCFTADKEKRCRFFSEYAPLFTVGDDGSTPAKGVSEPVLFDEMCLMGSEQSSCSNPGCPYWHKDQIAHVKLGAQKLVFHASLLTNGRSDICDAAAMFTRFYEASSTATDLADALRIHRDAVNLVANLGWAAAFVDGEGAHKAQQQPSVMWDTPLLPKLVMSLQDVAPLLRDPRERVLWGEVVQSSSKPICEATRLFQQQTDSISWRCLMRVTGAETERLLWLATHGVALFPLSPSIRLSYIVALLRSGCVASDCVNACIQSAQILSTQAATSIFSSQDVQWGETAARYIAYMIALTCVHVADINPKLAVDLVTTVLSVPGSICLLPLAQQNLTLMMIVLRETNRLEGAFLLPLASISDVAFVFSEHFSRRPQDASAQLLSKQLSLVTDCVASGITEELTECMRSAIHISLMRAFSSDAQLVEQILAETPIHSVVGMGELWGEYFRFVGERGGTSPLVTLVQSVLVHLHSPLLMLYFVRCLFFHGEDVGTLMNVFLQQFASSHGISLESVCDKAASDTPGVPTVDWIPFVVLYSRLLPPQETLDLLFSIPISLYCESVEMVVLIWFEMLHASVLLKQDEVFGRCTEHGLLLLREPFLHSFSPIDYGFDEMISFAHQATLMLYRAVPVLLGASYQLTGHYRRIVLSVGAKLHVVHPTLFSAE